MLKVLLALPPAAKVRHRLTSASRYLVQAHATTAAAGANPCTYKTRKCTFLARCRRRSGAAYRNPEMFCTRILLPARSACMIARVRLTEQLNHSKSASAPKTIDLRSSLSSAGRIAETGLFSYSRKSAFLSITKGRHVLLVSCTFKCNPSARRFFQIFASRPCLPSNFYYSPPFHPQAHLSLLSTHVLTPRRTSSALIHSNQQPLQRQRRLRQVPKEIERQKWTRMWTMTVTGGFMEEMSLLTPL